MTDDQPDKFPAYHGGDVSIMISPTQPLYRLYRNVLIEHSSTFNDILTTETAAKLSQAAIKKGRRIKYHLELKMVKNRDAIPHFNLEQYLIDERGQFNSPTSKVIAFQNGLPQDPYHIAWDAVLGALNNIPLHLGDFGKDTLTDILNNAVRITEVAEHLDCVSEVERLDYASNTDIMKIPVITQPIEAIFLSTGQVVQKSIYSNPVAWLDFAYRIRSKILFREALIHATAQYFTTQSRDNLSSLDDHVHAFLKKKAERMKKSVKDSFLQIMTYLPNYMHREESLGRADKDSIGQASYAKQVYEWQALNIIRTWVGMQIACDETHQAQDMGKSVVDPIMQGGNAYLSKPDLVDFHRFCPMTSKGKNALEDRINLIKENIKGFLKPLTKNMSQLDLKGLKVEYFTCVRVDHDEYPWDTNAQAHNQIQRDTSDGAGEKEDDEYNEYGEMIPECDEEDEEMESED
ncbi:hypothetical protein LTR78_003223 [Recurvomyces mirabilis]|uniref:Uncharacterized protein n=1 Tax=Recurvomyces mirabilis TaxID=574656 RepID=A0AAE0WSH9_9PEZI|nr:hypothetical protein LTR78_003223 [Recurvomyces mirabilis]KAK5156959.1 hypothetical protein LTS14_004476 [Recurvomyces mirabilis]